MKKIMIQKIAQNNWNFWTVNLIMRAKKLLTSRQIFRYAVPARTVTKKHWSYDMVWYGMVNVESYSAIITKVSNALILRLAVFVEHRLVTDRRTDTGP